MGYFDNEMGEMLGIYLMETGQLLEQADAILMNAEKAGHLSREDINGIFRVMHTTKSSSAMMGLNELSALAHRLEDVFSEFRDDPSKLTGMEREAFDVIFDVTGFIRSELDRMSSDDFAPRQTEELIGKINGLVSKLKNDQAIIVNLRFEKNCRMENVRAFMAARQIQKLCSTVAFYPENVETDPSTVGYIQENGFFISFTAEDPEAVLKRLSRALFVESCQLVEEMPESEKVRTPMPVGGNTQGQMPAVQAPAKAEEAPGAETEHPLSTESTGAPGGMPETKERSKVEVVRGKAGDEKPVQSGSQEPVSPRADSNFINVKLERLDQLQNVTEELLIAYSALKSSSGTALHRNSLDNGVERQMERTLKELKDLVGSIRMVPFSGLVPKLNRIVRDMGRKERKEIDFVVTGQDVEVDKAVADGMMEPLLHLIRNAVDHGIESPEIRERNQKSRVGRIELRFANLGGEISVEIEDDGAGMDLERIKQKAKERGLLTKAEEEYTREELLELCFLPGFSTCDNTSEFSGRGVGMDVVYQTVEQLGGHIRLESELGKGSEVHVTLPLTLTIIDGICFQAGEYSFALPSHQVRQFFAYESEAERMIYQNGRQFWVHDGKYVPVIFLNKFYQTKHKNEQGETVMAYVRGPEHEACLVLDWVTEQGSIVEKALPALLGKRFKYETGIAGCSILGDGSACMLLDIEALIRASARGERRDGAAREINGSKTEESDLGDNEVLCIEVEDAYYGIELPYILELLDDVKISPLPCLPAWFEGISSRKGTLLPILSFCRLAGLSEKAERTEWFHVVTAIKGGGYECGFLTDKRPELFRISAGSQLKGERPAAMGAGVRIKGMYSLNEKVLFIVDVAETLKSLTVTQ